MSTQPPAKPDVWQARHQSSVPQRSLRRFVAHSAGTCLPERVYWCDGSQQEQGMLRASAASEEPGPPAPDATHIDFAHAPVKTRLSDAPEEFSHWTITSAEQRTLHELFRGCMEGRTMYVLPFVVPPGDGGPKVSGMQITDSPAAVLSIQRFPSNCDGAWEQVAQDDSCLCVLHSRGVGAKAGRQMYWFPRERTVWAYGPGYDMAALVHAVNATRNAG